MEAARWERLESLCADALDMDAPSRAAFLERACEGDPELRGEVESLIRHLGEEPDFLEVPLVDLAALDRESAEGEPLPEPSGRYRLLRRIGRGGMGDVYLAERRTDDVAQQVALKLIRRGRGGAEVLRRFRLERRILASLSHPNIAGFLDASVTRDGRPYFVMEYVDGVPVDEYCDRHRLSVPERLRLFLVICRAVEHAHGKLVVHRDLKPRNILVTPEAAPKLLDFGIAKVLAPDEHRAIEETHAQVRLLTPEYAAPEQLTGAPITTATDVYGLGLLLYVLLTGRHPFAADVVTGQGLERALLELEPVRPSEHVGRDIAGNLPSEHVGGDVAGTLSSPVPAPSADMIAAQRQIDVRGLRRKLVGDLDTIVLKALRKEPSRRYQSAAALAEDIQRHLDGLPVSARPDTLGYRARKFARRNAGWVAAATVAFAALFATTIVTLVQSRRVEREAARVSAERDKALEVRSFLMEMFGASGADRLAGDTLTVRRLLDLQAANLDVSYADRPELRAEMMEVLADGYDRLGIYQAAEPLARGALELRRSTLPEGHPDLASSLNVYGWVLHELGRTKEAEPLLREAVAIRRAGGAEQLQNLSRSLNDLGVILTALARYPEAAEVLDEALEIRRVEHGDEHRSVGVTASNLAAVHYYEGRLDDAVRVQTLALEALRKAVGDEHQRSTIALSNLATFKTASGDWEGAIQDYRVLAARHEKLQGRGHLVTTRVREGLGITLYHRGWQLDDRAMMEEGEALLEETVVSYGAISGPSAPQVGIQLYRVALAESALGKHEEAVRSARRAVENLRAALGDAHPSTANARSSLAIALAGAGRPEEGAAEQRAAVAVLEAAGPQSLGTAGAQAILCDLLLRSGDAGAALSFCEKAEPRLRDASRADKERLGLPLVQLHMAQAYRAQGRRSAADSMLVELRRSLESGVVNVRARRALDSIGSVGAAGG
jgi:serine/threonine-protein kinase